MAKDYLAMIADIEITDPELRKKGIKGKKPPLVTPSAILASSRYGSLTRGGLRDAFIFAARARGWRCTVEDALLSIDVAIEAGLIVGPDLDGLFRVRQ